MATNCYDITYLIWEASVTGKRFYRWKKMSGMMKEVMR